MELNAKVSQLNRVAKTLERKLGGLGIETVQDLLCYFPFRYEDYSKTVDISNVVEGERVTIKGKIELIENKRGYWRKRMVTEAIVADDSGQLKVVWFGQPYITKLLKMGDDIYLSGKVMTNKFGTQMVSPSYEKAKKITAHTARIVPMYKLTKGISQKQMRFLMTQIIDLADKVTDWLPEGVLDKADLIPFGNALRGIHFPENDEDLEICMKRLKFDELFVLQLRGEMVRQAVKQSKAPQIKFKKKETKEFVDSLPFKLTNKQKIVGWEILQDMEKAQPMNRLVEGDVGSGKTVVAALAMYSAVLNKYQTVIMAPTEVLARQHFLSLQKLLGEKISIGLLTRVEAKVNKGKFSSSSQAGKKREMLGMIKEGGLQIVIGTHALITGKVEFGNLGLVVVDEQHRFGVEQRKMLREKSGDEKTSPHFLSMTATPIPRSFALTMYGELDLSMIDEMPLGRKPIKTKLVDPLNRGKAYDFIKTQVKKGRQCFVVCPLIEDVDEEGVQVVSTEKKTVTTEYEKLSKEIFPELKIGYLHGRMKSDEKEDVMQKFSQGRLDVMVSTSVVEVGVDVPNATVMMIEGAERFGLAQLHQFRGRVGRSEHQSYCILFTGNETDKSRERLEFFSSNNSGFKVAEYDLEMRGPGEVYGSAQSGVMKLRLATMQDKKLIKLSRELARGIDFAKHPSLREKVKQWEKTVHLE